MADGDASTLTNSGLTEALAEALRIDRERINQDAASRSANERLVMGAFGAWLRHRWKVVTGVLTIVGALGGGGWKGWTWMQVQAEEAVLERQATQTQATAVEENTKAVGELRDQSSVLTDRVGGLETKVQAASDIQQVLLELQLRDPKTKRLIRADKKLKEQVEAIPGVELK